MMAKTWIKVIAALCLSLGGFTGEANAKTESRDEKAIGELMSRLAVAINAKDTEGVMAAYVPDESLFLFDMIPPRQYVGVAAMRKHWDEDFFAKVNGPIQYVVTDLAISASNGIGYSHSIQRLIGTDSNGNPVDITMRFSDVYRKIRGRWRIVMEHVSVPVDPATGRPDFASRP